MIFVFYGLRKTQKISLILDVKLSREKDSRREILNSQIGSALIFNKSIPKSIMI